ncbi:hypothetical protein WJX74_009678 [Apatococcus lobatus]|uniref:Large ribosomal subunit protein uL3m n=2 Tax=Apatococcus TaxID=904362 RepID=A0AAW1RGL8_9CHLO
MSVLKQLRTGRCCQRLSNLLQTAPQQSQYSSLSPASVLAALQARLADSGAVPSSAAHVPATHWQQSPALEALSRRGYVQPAYAETSSDEEDEAPKKVAKPQRPRRSGLIAVKAGMTHAWDEHGARIPLTVLWVDSCQVIQAKTDARHGYTALQLGIGSKRAKRMPAKERGHFAQAGQPLKRKLAEFRVTEDALLPAGTELRADHFVAGQYVDIQGTTLGKGFQGVMKRWGFAGQPASHGNTKAHRKAGGTGACQDPGKIWKGKKMAGQMGNKLRTVLSVWIYKVDPARNLLWVRGQVPGHKGNFVKIEDAVMKTVQQQPSRPFPTVVEHGSQIVTAPAPQNAFQVPH